MPGAAVSIIIPVYNDAAGLDHVLTELEAQARDVPGTQIVVVDNGSTEDMAGVQAAHPAVVWTKESQPGSYAARNKGLTLATGADLVFIDADCRPVPGWLQAGLQGLRDHPEAGAVGGPVHLFAADEKHPTATELYEMAYGFPMEEYAKTRGFIGTGNLFTRRAVFDRVGPFNAALRSGGDYEWGQRLKKAGYPIAFLREVAVRHPARRELSELVSKRRRTFHGTVALGQQPQVKAGTAGFLRWLVPHAIPRPSVLRTSKQRRPDFSFPQRVRVMGVRWVLQMTEIRESWRVRRGRAGDAPR